MKNIEVVQYCRHKIYNSLHLYEIILKISKNVKDKSQNIGDK